MLAWLWAGLFILWLNLTSLNNLRLGVLWDVWLCRSFTSPWRSIHTLCSRGRNTLQGTVTLSSNYAATKEDFSLKQVKVQTFRYTLLYFLAAGAVLWEICSLGNLLHCLMKLMRWRTYCICVVFPKHPCQRQSATHTVLQMEMLAWYHKLYAVLHLILCSTLKSFASKVQSTTRDLTFTDVFPVTKLLILSRK